MKFFQAEVYRISRQIPLSYEVNLSELMKFFKFV